MRLSRAKFATHIEYAFHLLGEMAQRLAENKKHLPTGLVNLINFNAFKPTSEASEVWISSDVNVSAIESRHIPERASYRIDTPAGCVVISGESGQQCG